MLKNYLKIASRNLIKKKGYSFLNIGGLTIGMACSILILLWVRNESSYDTFHDNADEKFRLTAQANADFKAAVSPVGMVLELGEEMPEIKESLLLSKPFDALMEVQGTKFKENAVFYASDNFLQFFNYPLLEGDPNTALVAPNGIVITESMAKKYFGEKNAMGQYITIDNGDSFMVTGILKSLPSNSHLQFKAVLPMAYNATRDRDLIDKVWNSFDFYGYFQFEKEAVQSPEAFARTIEKINTIYAKRQPDFEIKFDLQAIKDIHLHSSNLQIDVPGHGNSLYVNLFLIVAFVILIVACINYMNLATAKSSKRAKEVGLRKVVGAGRHQLILQFLGESLIISFLSLALATILVYLLLPSFNDLTQKVLSPQFNDPFIVVSMLSMAIVTGILSGSYPALFLSGFKPVRALKGKLMFSKYNQFFRNGLVISQFAISVLLLIGTMVIYDQVNYIRDKNLGFDKSNLIYIPMEGEMFDKQEALKSALTQNKLTSDFSIISDIPANLVTGDFNVSWEGKDPNLQVFFPSIRSDERFLEVFQMQLLSGSNFSKTSFENHDYLVNETTVKTMGLTPEQAIGKNLRFRGNSGTILGVVKDFNFKPLQHAMEPLIIQHHKGGRYAVVKVAPNTIKPTIAALEKIYGRLNPAYPLTYNFMDAHLDAQYKGEQQMGAVFNVFALLAIFISCMGLYGLSAYMAEQRFKEIGIRKVLGASSLKLLHMLSKDYLKLVLAAFVLALPVAWYVMDLWLQEFAYHVELQWWMFALAGLILLLVALSTVSFQSLKASMANPIKSLRTE
jgi:ABC-type antimicrobial peptide transport system permease subunit